MVSGQSVRLVPDVSDRDRFDRLLRYFHVGDLFVNEAMVESGLAEARRYEPETDRADVLEEAQRRAETTTSTTASTTTASTTTTIAPVTTILTTTRTAPPNDGGTDVDCASSHHHRGARSELSHLLSGRVSDSGNR